MIEIEFIPIGEEVNTGDAILVHFTEPETGADRVLLIDGGFVDTSESIMSHVRKYYGRTSIDLIVCTHPDDDHINGLTGVIENFTVYNLLIHDPREHGFTGDEVKATKVKDLIDVARENDVNVITEAFAGQMFYSGAIMVAGPTQDFYVDQLKAQTGVSALAAALFGKTRSTVQEAIAALRRRLDDPGEGTLSDNGGTSARNNSSIILDIQVEGYRALMTGDAGVPALEAAANTLDSLGRVTQLPDFFDVPHHGSRHNLNTDIANRLLGPIVGDKKARTAFASVGKKASDFPRPEVANALKRRGYRVSPTRGQTIRWSRNAPPRAGWVSLEPLDWLEVDD